MRSAILLAMAANLLPSSSRAKFEGVLEFEMSGANLQGTVHTWVASAGIRNEIDIKTPLRLAERREREGETPGESDRESEGTEERVVTIVQSGKPNVVYTLNQEHKTFGVQAWERPTKTSASYDVKRAGKDSVRGVACENVVVSSSRGTVTELCLADGLVQGAAWSSFLKTRAGQSDDIESALLAAGVNGIPLRAVTRAKSGPVFRMELVSITTKPVPAAMFEIPKDYTRSTLAPPIQTRRSP